MNNQSDYITAIQTVSTQNKRFYQLSQTEKLNLIYLFVRVNFVDLCRNEDLKTVLVKYYSNFTRSGDDLDHIGIEVMNIIHQKIIAEISLDLDDELANLYNEHIEAFPDHIWHLKDRLYYQIQREEEDDNWRQLQEQEEQQQWEASFT